jgi:hypothetical protein
VVQRRPTIDTNPDDDLPPGYTEDNVGEHWDYVGEGHWIARYRTYDANGDALPLAEYQDPTIDTDSSDDDVVKWTPAREWECHVWWRVGYAYRNRRVCVDGVCVIGRERGRLECTLDLRARGRRHVKVTSTRPSCTMFQVD